MSRMVPQRLVNSLKGMNDFAVKIFGVDCQLYIPQNWSDVEIGDAYVKPKDWTFKKYSTTVWVDWTPNKYRLQKYGLYLEENLPIIAAFSNKLTDESGFPYETEILINSYFTIPIQYIPEQYKSDSLEIVDVLIPKGMHDAVTLKAYKIAPKRTPDA